MPLELLHISVDNCSTYGEITFCGLSAKRVASWFGIYNDINCKQCLEKYLEAEEKKFATSDSADGRNIIRARWVLDHV